MNKTITAYIFDSKFTGMSDADAARLTHVNYSFALIKKGQANISHWWHKKKLWQLMERHPELPVNLSVGGWKADGFSAAVATEAGRERLAESLRELVDRHGFAGVDLDWEYPGNSIAGIASSPEDAANFPLFVNLLKEKLGRNRRLTMAVGAGREHVAGIRYRDMAGAVDQINVMTYDMAPWGRDMPTTHHAALYPSAVAPNGSNGAEAIAAYAAAGIPWEKLVMGMPFYGRFYSGVKPGEHHGLNQLHESDLPLGMPYGKIKERLAGTAARYWDKEAMVPYLYDPADEVFVTYEDAESLRCKTRYVREKGLGGVMFWEYTGADTAELLEALYNGMNTPE